MLEQDIRETYRRMAEAKMPLSQISIPAAGRTGGHLDLAAVIDGARCEDFALEQP